MMLAVSSQRSQGAVLLLSVLLTLLDVSHGVEPKTPNAKDQTEISDQNNRGPETSSRTLVSIHRRDVPKEYNYVKMEWETFEGRVPTDAVPIREDDDEDMYVCRNMEKKCSIGILKGSKCEYETGEEGKLQNPGSFEVLVNKDNFESLEWKSIKCTQEVEEVRENAVLICDDQNLFVGRRREEAKSLPAEKSARRKKIEKALSIQKTKTKDIKKLEAKTGTCKVLTVSYENVKEQKPSDLVFDENNKRKTNMGEQTEEVFEVTNENNKENKYTVQPSKTISRETRWDLSYSLTKGVKLTIGAKLPKDFQAALEFSRLSTTTEKTGTSVKQDTGIMSSFEVQVPPKSKCAIKLVSRQCMTETPFTFKLTRYYKRGESKTKNISGTYVLTNAGKTEVVMGECTPLHGGAASAGRGNPGKVIIIRAPEPQNKGSHCV